MNRSFFATAGLLAAGLSPIALVHAQSGTYTIDPAHTFVTFEVAHFGTSTNRGRFDKKEGTVQFDRAGKTGKVDLTLDTSSINTGTAPFDKHLQSKDLFNSAEFPSARFVAERFNFKGDQVSDVVGSLTMLGKTLPVTLTASRFNCYTNPIFKREVCGGDFETTIARSQWGMTWGTNFGIPDNVKLLIQVEAIKQ
jgi:polyisoprenoid-binding protein YceI